MTERLILFMYESWAQLDSALEGLSVEDALRRPPGDSAIAWTVGHVSQMVDSWLNVNFQGLAPHPLIGSDAFRSGASGDASDWEAIVSAVTSVRESARRFLDSAPDLDRAVPYNGSILYLRSTGLRLSYAVMRITAHHFIHAGEILSVRSRMGHSGLESSWAEWGRALL